MGFCLLFPFKLSFLCLKRYGQKRPLDLWRSLCQIFFNENVLIIFPINLRKTVRESCFPSASGITPCQPVTFWACQIGGFRPPSLFFFFSHPCLVLDLLFGHAGSACCPSHGPRVQHRRAHTDVRKGAHVNALKKRRRVIKTGWFAWEQSKPCLPFCLLGLGGK